jgi:hypothetical protein
MVRGGRQGLLNGSATHSLDTGNVHGPQWEVFSGSGGPVPCGPAWGLATFIRFDFRHTPCKVMKIMIRSRPIRIASVCRSNSVIHIKALRSATITIQCLAVPRNLLVKDSSVIKKSIVVTQRLFRTKEAAHYLGMSAWALRQEVGKGELPFISSGENTSCWKFDVGDLDAWVERHRVNF